MVVKDFFYREHRSIIFIKLQNRFITLAGIDDFRIKRHYSKIFYLFYLMPVFIRRIRFIPYNALVFNRNRKLIIPDLPESY